MTHEHFDQKPHGNFAPKPECGGYIIREPKGIPDVLLCADISEQQTLFSAANILSVQGITARLVLIEDAARFSKQTNAYQETIFTDQPSVRIGILHDESAQLLAKNALTILPHGTSASDFARRACRYLDEQRT